MNLRILRALLGMSQRQLARALHVDHRRISELEQGHREFPREQAHLLAKLIVLRVAGEISQADRGAEQ